MENKEVKKVTIFAMENCPRCQILKQRLDNNNIKYEIGDIQEVISLEYTTAPILKIGAEYLQFGEAIKWLKERII